MEACQFLIKFQTTEIPAEYIKDKARAAEILQALDEVRGDDCLFGIDTETEALPEFIEYPMAALNPHLSTVRLLQLYDGVKSFVFDMKYIQDYAMFVPFLESRRFIGHNSLFDLKFFKHRFGVQTMNIGCTYILTKLIHHAVYPEDTGLQASLDYMVKSLFKEDILKKVQNSGWHVPDLTFEQIEYAAMDAVCTLKIAEKLSSGLTKYGLEKIYQLYKKAQHPIADMELAGIRLDVETHKEMISVWRDKLYETKKEVLAMTKLEEITGHKVGKWLEENLPEDVLAVWPRTDTGKLSTDANTFADFSYLDIVKPFSKFQKLEKLTSTYGMSLQKFVNPVTGRLHSNYNICGARTGRLSSSKPNLQQAPRDKEFRKLFVPEEGNVFIVADYNQIELRVAGELSRDEVILDVYKQGGDLHTLTASRVSGKPLSAITKDDRQMAKALNFGLLFGLGAKKFSHYAKKSYGVEVSREDATRAIEIFRDTYAGYREWQMEQVNASSTSLSVRTPMGKLRCLPQDNTYGTSMATPVQGGAAECMLYALCFLRDTPSDLNMKLVNCVHDEVVFEIDPNDKTRATEFITASMTKGFLAVFPQGVTKNLVAIDIGTSWDDAK